MSSVRARGVSSSAIKANVPLVVGYKRLERFAGSDRMAKRKRPDANVWRDVSSFVHGLYEELDKNAKKAPRGSDF